MSKSLMKHRCTINRTTTSNAEGVPSNSPSALATGVRCLIQEKQGQFQTGKAGEWMSYDAIGFFLPGQDIQPQSSSQNKDQIEMTSPARLNGRKFLVMHVADESGMGNHLTVFLKHVPSS